MSTSLLETAIANVAAPSVDISLLNSAPQAALLLQGLSILAACTIDASLVNSKTNGMVKLLKTPGSFRASLYQTSTSMSDAFRTADQSMLRIKINLDDVPQILTSLVNAYAKPDDASSKFIEKLRLRNFHDVVRICNEEATKAREKFDETLSLIHELIQVSTATVGDNEEKVREAKKLFADYERQKAALQVEGQKLDEDIKKQQRLIQEASKKFDEVTKKMTNGWHVLAAGLSDALKSVTSFMGQKSQKTGQNGQQGGKKTSGPQARINASGVLSGSAMASYERAAELSKELYIYQREKEIVLMKEASNNRMALAQIATKLANSNIEQLKMEEILYYLSKGIKILGQIQEQWSRLQKFFATLESIIIGPTSRHLSDFDEIVKQEQLRDSGLLRNELAITSIKAASYCISVFNAAKAYNEISTKYVMPQIDTAVIKMTMPRDTAKAKLLELEGKMEQATKEVNEFIEGKLVEMKDKATEQMTAIATSFQKSLDTPMIRG